MRDSKDSKVQNRYKALVEKIFFDNYKRGVDKFEFHRNALSEAAEALDIEVPKNLGDILYSVRYRAPLPDNIVATQPAGMEWVIEGAGRSRYAFKLVRISRIKPNPALLATKIPDATPQIINSYALSDEQALLAKVRYNRLVDIFLGIAAYSLQNHLRTTVPKIGQIEIDEIYIGIDKRGGQYVLPVQAKGGKDQLSTVQAKQDLEYCRVKFPGLIRRAVAAQFMENDLIAMFELVVEGNEVRVAEERHYRLVVGDEITEEDLRMYAMRTP
jgi:hypothetical protein